MCTYCWNHIGIQVHITFSPSMYVCHLLLAGAYFLTHSLSWTNNKENKGEIHSNKVWTPADPMSAKDNGTYPPNWDDWMFRVGFLLLTSVVIWWNVRMSTGCRASCIASFAILISIEHWKETVHLQVHPDRVIMCQSQRYGLWRDHRFATTETCISNSVHNGACGENYSLAHSH